MGEVAAASVNPNTEVGAETSVRPGAGATFRDLDDAMDAREAEKPEKKTATTKVKEEDGKKAPAKPKAEDDDSSGDDVKPPKKDEKEDKDDKKERDGKPRAKKLKFKVGDDEGEVSNHAVFKIPVDGKDEEVTLQDLYDEFHGKKFHQRKASEYERKDAQREKEFKTLQTHVQRFAELSKEDPSAGVFFLAELQGADPTELAMNMLQTQLEMGKEYWSLGSDEARQAWLERKEVEFGKKANERAKKNRAAEENEAKTSKARQEAQKTFGVDDAEYERVSERLREHLQKKDPNFKGDPHPVQVMQARCWIVAEDVIKEAAPHLVGDANYDTILEDAASMLLRHPNFSRDRLAKTLKENFGQGSGQEGGGGDENLKEVARRIARNDDAHGDDKPAGTRKTKKGYESFSDFEDD